MTAIRWFRTLSTSVLVLFLIGLSGMTAAAQTKLEGIIQGRSGPEIYLKTADNPKVVILLTDNTDVAQVQGLLKARKKEMSMAALIPGLPIQVEGMNTGENQLTATKIRFKGNDLQQAQAIQAGLAETRAQTQQNKEELERQDAELAKQNAELAKHKAEIDAAVARFGQLDDYYILDEVPVLFGNGKVDVDPKYNPQLMALVEKAKSINGYMIQVKGYASATGSAALNQRLSDDRANNVTNILLQQGHVPLTNILAPGAMGESEQVEASGTPAEVEAANRRVVVQVLQNKAVAGIPNEKAGAN
jgi:outer membrane protein OmpA-like peptidoglycan-associated protein